MTVKVKCDGFFYYHRLINCIILIKHHGSAGFEQILQLFCLWSERRYFDRSLLVVTNSTLFVFGAFFGFRRLFIHNPLVIMIFCCINYIFCSKLNTTIGIFEHLAAHGAHIVSYIAVFGTGRRICRYKRQLMCMLNSRSDNVVAYGTFNRLCFSCSRTVRCVRCFVSLAVAQRAGMPMTCFVAAPNCFVIMRTVCCTVPF